MFIVMIPKKFYRLLKCTWNNFLVAFIFLPVFAFAQKTIFTPGIIGGINTSQVSGDDLFGFNQFGAYGGLTLCAGINDKSSFEFQISFSQKGSRRPPDQNGTPSLYKLRLNYIDIPIFWIRHFTNGKIKNFNLEAGIVNSYLINYSEENIYGHVTPVRPFKKYEYGLLFGLSYRISDQINFGARLQNSVLPIRQHMSGATYYWNRGQYNTIVQFVFQYNLRKPEKVQ